VPRRAFRFTTYGCYAHGARAAAKALVSVLANARSGRHDAVQNEMNDRIRSASSGGRADNRTTCRAAPISV
jgi:hypothetical protein